MENTTSIEMIIPTREAHISEKFMVRRVLPFRAHRMVGPFCFLDHMGPHKISAHHEADVLMHPHIGLSTLTYLFTGEINHHDSTGAFQTIRPGDVNWMTAGSGVTHSERIPLETAAKNPILHGLQAWVALPAEKEEMEPFFKHYKEHQIPTKEKNGVKISLVAGKALGLQSPVEVSSELFYLKIEFSKNSTFQGSFPQQESAFYLINGSVSIDDQTFSGPTMIVFRREAQIEIKSTQDSLGIMLGGAPMPEGRLMYWNFVATKKDLIEKAKLNWKEQRFPKVPGETEYVPLPTE